MRDGLAPAAERGHLDVRPRVVEKVARRAAGEVDGVVPSTAGRLGRTHLPDVSSSVHGRRTRLDVAVALRWGLPAADVAARVRDHVTTRVQQLTGLTVAGVDVSVDALVVPTTETAGRVG